MINRDTALYGILALVLSGPTYASLNCVSQPTCEAMGYVKNETCSDGSLVTCPFDSEYAKCVKKIANAELCTQFPLTSCPDNATCYKCETETTTKYAFNACNEGYSANDNNTGCNINCTYADETACENANANTDCTEVNGCYELTGCKEGYTLNSAGTGCETCSCNAPNPNRYINEDTVSDCTMYGNYDGCHDSYNVSFDQASFDQDFEEYQDCLQGCNYTRIVAECKYSSESACENSNSSCYETEYFRGDDSGWICYDSSPCSAYGSYCWLPK